MNITIDENIWCSNELGVLDKMIIAESIRTELKEVNDELYGHMLLFTRCNPDNVTRSINRLLDLNLLTGNKLYERRDHKDQNRTRNSEGGFQKRKRACTDGAGSRTHKEISHGAGRDPASFRLWKRLGSSIKSSA